MRTHLETFNSTEIFRRQLSRMVAKRVSPYKLNMVGYRILNLLYPAKSLTSGSIAKSLALQPTHASNVLKSLRKAAYIVEDVDQDFRANNFKLSTKGKGLLVTLSGRIENDYNAKVREISAADKEAFKLMLKKFADALL